MTKPLPAVQKRNLLARLETIAENERNLEEQRTDALLTLMNTQSVLEELREEKNNMLGKLIKII